MVITTFLSYTLNVSLPKRKIQKSSEIESDCKNDKCSITKPLKFGVV